MHLNSELVYVQHLAEMRWAQYIHHVCRRRNIRSRVFCTPCGSSREANKSPRVIGNKFQFPHSIIFNITNLHPYFKFAKHYPNKRDEFIHSQITDLNVLIFIGTKRFRETINYILLDLHPVKQHIITRT